MYTATPEALQAGGIGPMSIPGALRRRTRGDRPVAAGGQLRPLGYRRTLHGGRRVRTAHRVRLRRTSGGAGFAERGYRLAATWLGATLEAIEACDCPQGCPSCVQSPKCGSETNRWTNREQFAFCGWCWAA